MATLDNTIKLKFTSKERNKNDIINDEEQKLEITATESFREKGVIAQSAVAHTIDFGIVGSASTIIFTPEQPVNMRFATSTASSPTFSLSSACPFMISKSPGREIISLKIDNDRVLGTTSYDAKASD